MSSNPTNDSEIQLRNLASLVAECRELAGKLDRLDEVSRQTAPFLFRQLGQSLQLLDQSVKKTLERNEGASTPSSSSVCATGGASPTCLAAIRRLPWMTVPAFVTQWLLPSAVAYSSRASTPTLTTT